MNVELRIRLTAGAALAVLLVLAWWWLATMHVAAGSAAAAMHHGHPFTGTGMRFPALLTMWCVMMAAMMLPAASPMVFAYLHLSRRRTLTGCLRRTFAFVSGYLLVWAGYSAVAALLQWGLVRGGLVSSGGWSTSAVLSGGLLLLAGGFQFTPLKHACLHKCRSPLGFFAYEWRPGWRGALVMGVRHGLYCVTCCWAYMLLMLVLGVMNVWWMLGLTLFVVVEKLAPAPALTGRVAGTLAIGWGLLLLLG